VLKFSTAGLFVWPDLQDVDSSVAKKELGFNPRDHEETVKDTIAYVRKHHSHPKVNGTKPCKGPPVQWLLPAVKGIIGILVALGAWRWFRRKTIAPPAAAAAAAAIAPRGPLA
jgi:hypothetical protein